jgi:hypothetical protein
MMSKLWSASESIGVPGGKAADKDAARSVHGRIVVGEIYRT